MNLYSKKNIINLFKKYNIKPQKKLGQNFLIDKNIIKKIIRSSNISKNDIVLEIGPGIGTLTIELSKKVKKVIAIEKDKTIIKILKETTKGFKNIKIINQDILKIKKIKINKKYKIIANLPYYIVFPFLKKFLEEENPPHEMILTIQKEVAQKIVKKPPKANFLSIFINFYCDSKILFFIPKESFWPKPKVDGAVIKLSNIKNKNLEVDKFLFYKVIKIGFSSPRKKIINNYFNNIKLNKKEVYNLFNKININPNLRPENLSLKDWIKLTEEISNLIL
ncbi:MAG TPA: 16S rRNA (adenine(1518)-N(6)/adenine(1519)-N(6))-dimethyltransferase RsmA [Candidatus Pacearchaeota archaeon]|nr:16S rRNA (adenine(1518)-N(6)/adenine(1519)-N(6))-dimethyltransferase RsmA [Candidatus Pacearchaeota archaeon]HOL90554.1 16S rRNA (adenine(1518)-N(6)/adenine(1519)-N(6))-dimethyltransferase RsmA [Candidatus Pacearchaeota archaeon]HPO68139.1 16S rRNA (adenine(1518)-N(6)/adenine(1519)-N(6))-dimethyltransferase RsmA [Candidatus Pacearchaeota archaeon]